MSEASKSATTEIQIGGFGGQGVVLAGMIIGRGLTLYENYHVSLTQSFGPEARGSACSVQLVVSRDPVLYPYLTQPDILITMNQDAFRRFSPNLRAGGKLIVEDELVKTEGLTGIQEFRIPAMRLAEELKRKMVLNVIMVGFFTAVTKMLSPESARKAVLDLVPKSTEALNVAAFEKGYAFGLAA